MDLQLAHRRAFVSGSTQGIGCAIARALLREGAAVVINGRDDRRVQEAVRRLEREVPGGEVSGIAADLADASETQRLLDALGGVDILVNNAGLFDVTPFADVDDAAWARVLDVNLMSGVRLSRALLPRMIDAGWGRIVFIGSESGVNVPADMVHYGVSKAAMLALGNGLAKLTRGTGVTVNTILGGPTYSDGVAAAVRGLASANGLAEGDVRAQIAGGNRTSLLERFLEPDEIATLAVYLASPLSSATNGAALRADGGVLTGML
ncbi:SDR family NAD(P)-dependent oxidoreductase [Rathayibacter sp. VKM Ac-2803]|uniref:SDR family NAD(P)-dependent oxidoreductase n=1 Tax=Rathayibacter sp. VKM Ac-2803 TaxID=2609256 RepID=UPI00135AB19D|nr:SDR family oxidoreductase [Rathayibacter sp. VKM Ac-2803]MWV48526.1 SDR family NAD(P)-dependent oxidoreductase [Rathayibacter sp. VKM Ac-2803]